MSAIRRKEHSDVLEEINNSIDEVEEKFLTETDRKLKEQYWNELQRLFLYHDENSRGQSRYK